MLSCVDWNATKYVDHIHAAELRILMSAHNPSIPTISVFDIENLNIVWALVVYQCLEIASVWEP